MKLNIWIWKIFKGSRFYSCDNLDTSDTSKRKQIFFTLKYTMTILLSLYTKNISFNIINYCHYIFQQIYEQKHWVYHPLIFNRSRVKVCLFLPGWLSCARKTLDSILCNSLALITNKKCAAMFQEYHILIVFRSDASLKILW